VRTTLGEILPIKYGKARNAQFGYVREESATYGSNGVFGTFNRALTTKPTIIVGRKGAAGAVHYSPEPCWPIDTAFYAEENENTHLPFFRYLLESLQLGALDRSTAIPSLSRDDYNAKEICYPESLPAQRRIVGEIEKQFTRLEAGVAALRRVQANLHRYRAAVLKAACEGRLVPTEAVTRKTFETGAQLLQRILKQRRDQWSGKGKYKEPAAPDTTGLPKLPDGWCWASVDQLTDNFDGRRVPLKEADRDKRSGAYPYYGASGIIDDIDDFLFDGDYLLIAEDGANLLSRSTPIAFRASGKFWVNNHAHVVQTFGGVPLTYLETFLNGLDLKFSITGSAQPKLTQAALNKIPVPLPPVAEQERIVAEVERRLSVVEELSALVTANLQRATRLRQSILQKAFTGQL
jgi:type I restriction enzyme S subunit